MTLIFTGEFEGIPTQWIGQGDVLRVDRTKELRGVMYVDEPSMLVTNRLVRAGCRGTRVSFSYHEDTNTADAVVSVKTLRGPLGWYARWWLARHPIEFTCQLWTQERGWYQYRTTVDVL